MTTMQEVNGYAQPQTPQGESVAKPGIYNFILSDTVHIRRCGATIIIVYMAISVTNVTKILWRI